MPLDSMLPGDRPYNELARFHAAAGATRRARELMESARRSSVSRGLLLDTDLAWTEGTILLAEGQPAGAEPLLRRATSAHWCTLCGLPELARALDAQGNTAGAVEAWERYLATPWFFRYELDAYELGPALMRLAELHAARNEAARARDTRNRLLALWRRADAELQPVLADIRTRVAEPEE